MQIAKATTGQAIGTIAPQDLLCVRFHEILGIVAILVLSFHGHSHHNRGPHSSSMINVVMQSSRKATKSHKTSHIRSMAIRHTRIAPPNALLLGLDWDDGRTE